MRKLLIVDDEKNIRLGLQAMIEREMPGHYAITFAVNGAEALQKLKEQTIDLVITDIRMPVMDGIELINGLQDMEVKPEVMILSGHDDFQYAREAMRCEVRMYLLKPIVREELAEALAMLEETLVKKETISHQFKQYTVQMKEHIETQFNYVFLRSDLEEREIEERLSKLDLPDLGNGYQLILLKWPGADQRGRDQGQKNAYLDLVLKRLGTQAEALTLRFMNRHGHLVVLTGYPALLPSLEEMIQQQVETRVKIGASKWLGRLAQVNEAYGQAEKALKYTLFYKHSVCLRYEELEGRESNYELPIASIKKISNMLGTDRESDVMGLFKEVVDLRNVMKYDISYMEGISRAFNELVFDQVFNVYGEESVEILKLYKSLADLYCFWDFQDYYHHVETLIQKLNLYVGNMKSIHNDNREMNKAIQYIHENYNHELNMAMVSNFISMNYSYFSQAFKEYTNESFVNYLKKIRIGKAKELLVSTNLKVHEIGERSGFENAKHFHRVFRELEGVSPNEYRQKEQSAADLKNRHHI
ncbi:response regulator transcription factor [Paenibacillus paeoniae]|uniref:response regulator transcription factor n=1 Tax=Paenibacillus paeoniae TaxID=2292705 RepID=UPI00140298FC|nr:response regulator [Paenibacillus paeoniae]